MDQLKPSNSPTELKESLLKTGLDSYSDEYSEIIDTWRNLESKAQGSTAIAGIFIAGIFAFIRELKPADALVLEKIVLSLSIICLVISVVLSIKAMNISKIAAPPIGENLDKLTKDLLNVEDSELTERMERFVREQMGLWLQVKTEANKIIELKAKYLWVAHLSLMTAIIIVALISITKIWD